MSEPHPLLGPRRARRANLFPIALACASMSFACAHAGLRSETPEERAARIHRDAIVIDTHSDTTPYFEDPSWDFGARHDDTDMDLPRIREGGLDAQFWSIYLPAREGDGRAIREALGRIDAVHQMVAKHSADGVVFATTAAEIREAARRGQFASLMGVEGGHIIEDRLAALRTYHRLGVRYMTLTHSFHTNWADSAGTVEVPEPQHDGLTEFGRDVVREMNRLGMMVDVSHVADSTFWDVLETTSAPVIASHSSCRALADRSRNMSDDMLRALAENGGVVMINFYPAYLDMETAAATTDYYIRWRETLEGIGERFAPNAMLPLWRARRAHYARHPLPQVPLSTLVEHIEHALEVAGPAHVGLGADWDGVASMPEGMESIDRLPALTAALLARGHSEDTVRGVLGENFLRVMEAVEARAASH